MESIPLPAGGDALRALLIKAKVVSAISKPADFAVELHQISRQIGILRKQLEIRSRSSGECHVYGEAIASWRLVC